MVTSPTQIYERFYKEYEQCIGTISEKNVQNFVVLVNDIVNPVLQVTSFEEELIFFWF